MADQLINRAELLIQQNRYEEASVVLKNLLNQEPENIQVLAMLSQVRLQQNNTTQAEQLVNSAISISPDTDYLYYIKARIAIYEEKYSEAEKHLEHATQLNPEDPDYFALWASVKLTRKQYNEALDYSDSALELDPENILGLNVRSTALLKLNRSEDSFETIEGALSHDPGNAYTHSNYGWGLLEKGDHKKALEHFREALKNDPQLEHAQAGMAEALKAKYLFYRLFLKYAFFISNLTAKYQWGVILGFYFATRLLRLLAKNNEGLRPFVTPLIVLIGLIAFSTWIITPISNLFLRFNRYGKFLLNKGERLSSNFVAVCLLMCLSGFILYSILAHAGWLSVAVFGFAMMIPLGSMFDAKNHKNKLIAYTSMMFVTGLLGIFQTFRTGDLFNTFSIIFFIGFIAYQWIANYFIIKQSNA